MCFKKYIVSWNAWSIYLLLLSSFCSIIFSFTGYRLPWFLSEAQDILGSLYQKKKVVFFCLPYFPWHKLLQNDNSRSRWFWLCNTNNRNNRFKLCANCKSIISFLKFVARRKWNLGVWMFCILITKRTIPAHSTEKNTAFCDLQKPRAVIYKPCLFPHIKHSICQLLPVNLIKFSSEQW